MSTDQTTNLGLPFLMPAQAQKHVTVNESLTRLDALVQLAVESRTAAAQPGSPEDGQLYILPPGKTGAAWGGYADHALAYYRDGAWEEIAPRPGWRGWVKDEGALVRFAGGSWSADLPAASLNGGPLAGLRNAIVNGGFDIWQRGASFADPPSGACLADRWRAGFDGAGAARTISRQSFTPGQTDVPGEPRFFLRWAQTVAGSGETFVFFEQRIEDVRTLAGRAVTFSIYARADAPRSVGFDLHQNFGSGGSGPVDNPGAALDVDTSWRKLVRTVTLAGVAGKTIGAGSYLGVLLALPTNTTLTIDLAQAQLEPGERATPAERRPAGLELQLCQRYFEKSYDLDTPPGTPAAAGLVIFRASGTSHLENVRLAARKRAAPAVALYNPVTGAAGSWRDYDAAADRTVSVDGGGATGETGFQVDVASSVDLAAMGGHWTADAEI